MTDELTSAVALLKRLKTILEHQRRFSEHTLNSYRRAATLVEGDIEEWLIDHGHQKSTERQEPLERGAND